MLRPILRYLLGAFILLLAAACNDEVFVPDTTLPVDALALAGDADTLRLRYEPRGLKHVALLAASSSAIVSYYNADDRSLGADADAAQVKRISYASPKAKFDIYLRPDSLIIAAPASQRYAAVTSRLELDYGYIKRQLMLTVRP